ncbi:MAG: hypothetical protein Q7S58_19525 [Candidatus Binatus sp.]|uniref:hypothetical protein n=1 Tax=Candidatus Binatus sp. TaxID=2811406 RepID=UPI0027244F7C|nr:hypothetical protein [Candidatus Binatus sp.]MDO8434593.1 hypothetical protein [Candidatus Binatus sp.]
MKIVTAILLALVFAGCAAAPNKSDTPAATTVPAEDAQAQASEPSIKADASSGPTIDKPPTFKKGFKLTFRSRKSDFDCTYEGEDDGLMVFHYDTKEKLPYDYLYTPDLKVAQFRTAQMTMRMDPPVGYVEFPLFVGKKWTTAYKGISNSSHTMAETAAEVVSYGPVKLPYGTLDAFEIRVRSSDREIGRANPYETYWYSPEIGYFVKHVTNRPVYEDPYALVAVTK